MMSPTDKSETFTAAGILQVSRAALQFARDFRDTVQVGHRGDWIVVFDWATSISLKHGPNEPYEDIGACMTIGASRRHEVPPEYLQTIDGVELAIQIPENVWTKSTQRLIDVDESLPFKLTLR